MKNKYLEELRKEISSIDFENEVMGNFKTEKIKPCPFCGEDNLHFHKEPSNDKTITWYKIIHGPTVPCGVSMLDTNKDELIKKWNTRVILNK